MTHRHQGTRVTCPLCAGEAIVTPRGTIGRHSCSDTRRHECAAYGTTPDEARDESAQVAAFVKRMGPPMTVRGIADFAGVDTDTAWCALVGMERRGEAVQSYGPWVMFAVCEMGP